MDRIGGGNELKHTIRSLLPLTLLLIIGISTELPLEGGSSDWRSRPLRIMGQGSKASQRGKFTHFVAVDDGNPSKFVRHVGGGDGSE